MSLGNGSARSKNGDESFLGINGTWTKLLRFITPAAVVAILVAVFNAGGTLNHIDDLAIQNCRALTITQTALHREHAHDRFRGLFPVAAKGCTK